MDTTITTESSQPTRSVGVLLVAAAAVGFGLNPVFAQVAFEADVPPEVTTLARYLIPALLVSPWLRWWRRRVRKLGVVALSAGLFNGLGTFAYFRALDQLPAPTVLAVYYTFPAFAVVFGRVFFGVRLTMASTVAAAAVVCGAAVAIGPTGVNASQLPLLLAAVAAPVAWSILLLLITTVLHPVPLAPLVAMVFLGASMAIIPFVIATGAISWSPTISGAGWLLVLGTVGVLIPALLVTAGGPVAGPTTTGLVGAFEFVVAFGGSWLVFGDALGIRTLFGAVLLIAGVAIAATTPSTDLKPREARDNLATGGPVAARRALRS